MNDIVYKILWSTIEDFVGLWEIWWEVNSYFPKQSPEENKEITKKVLSYFLENNLVTFYFGSWGSEELISINSAEVMIIIDQEKYWLPPATKDTCIKIGNTEKGDKYYNDKLIKDSIF
jgi:hypothetical protein